MVYSALPSKYRSTNRCAVLLQITVSRGIENPISQTSGPTRDQQSGADCSRYRFDRIEILFPSVSSLKIAIENFLSAPVGSATSLPEESLTPCNPSREISFVVTLPERSAASSATPLSSSPTWNDLLSGGVPIASPTTVNAAIVSGNVPGGGGYYSGGVENLPRFLGSGATRTRPTTAP